MFYTAPLLCLLASPPAHEAGPGRPNILLVVLDDLGPERLSFYGTGPSPAPTPNLNQLAATGLVFTQAWSNPTCGPTRACINTGLYGIHSGIGSNPGNGQNPGLPLTARTLPECLPSVYSCAAVGKWHLGGDADGPTHPNDSGYGLYTGSLRNLTPNNYNDWNQTTNGVTTRQLTYAPSANVNDALRAIAALPEPFFLYVCLNSIHTPLHIPPAHLHTQSNLPPDPDSDPIGYVTAMTEAAGTELGRLFGGLPPNTYTIVVGDNGAYSGAVEPPLDPRRVKPTVYQGGVSVPLIIQGPSVRMGREDSIVSVVDLFLTVLEMAQATYLDPTDSVSLRPYFANQGLKLRQFVYAERFAPNGIKPMLYSIRERAARDQRFKLIRHLNQPDEFYDLYKDPLELRDLLQAPLKPGQQAAYGRISAYMDSL